MKTIADIDRELDFAKKQLENTVAALEHHQDDFTYQIQLERDEKNYHRLLAEKIKYQSARHKEIVQLHLEGPTVNRGAIPLSALADLSNTFSGSITESALQLQYGREKVSGNERNFVNDQLNLCLDRIESGSTRLFVTGNTNPDLFGQSLMQQSIIGMYDLLETDDAEELLNKSINSSRKALRETGRWLNTLGSNRMECELIWDNTDFEFKRWEGTLPRIGQITQSLKQIQTTQASSVALSGKLITVSLRGRGYIEIDTGKNELIRIGVSNTQRENLNLLELGNMISVTVRKTEFKNTFTRLSRLKYDLEKVDKGI